MRSNLLLAIVALLGITAIAELGLRGIGFSYHLYPQEIEFGAPKPTRIKNFFQVDRDLYWVPKPYFESLDRARQSRPKLIFMGDSCTQFGRYDEAFAELWADRHDTSLSYTNLGVGGWSSYQGLHQLERDILPLTPRVITIYYGWNDHWIGFGIQDKDVRWINSSPIFALLEASRVAQLVSKAYVAVKGENEQWPLRVSPEDFRRNLTDLVRLAREHGITPVLLTAPTSHEVGKEPAYLTKRHLKRLEDLVPLHQRYAAIVREVARIENVVLCDLIEDFAKQPSKQLHTEYFLEDGIHLQPAGNAFLASRLYACFEANGLLEKLLSSGVDSARAPEVGPSP